MVPWVGMLYASLVVWFWEQYEADAQAVVPVRRWYKHKKGLSFQDIVRTARVALGRVDVVEEAARLAPLRKVRVVATKRAMNAERKPSHAKAA